jgi:hypothetical protein
MTERLSFTKYENECLPRFRQKINEAESTEDVKKFFVYTMKDLLESVLEGNVEIQYDDVSLKPHGQSLYAVSERLFSTNIFKSLWSRSDLPRVIGRFAASATRRYRRLEKHREKTDAKIRMQG